MKAILTSALALSSILACGGHTPPPAETVSTPSTTSSMTTEPPATSASARVEPVAAPPTRKVTFAAAEMKEGMVIEFTKQTRRQSVALKDGKPGTATVVERMVAGTITIKELDEKKQPKKIDVSFASGSTDTNAFTSKVDAKDAAFYAGKMFSVKRGESGVEVVDDKGKPAFANAGAISFVTNVVGQIVPIQGFLSNGHGLAAKLAGRSIGVGERTDDLISFQPGAAYGKERAMVLASEREGVAVFDLHVDNAEAREMKAADGTVSGTNVSTRQATSSVHVPLATSLWTIAKYKNASQTESKSAKTGSTFLGTWQDEVTITRTFK